MAETSEEAEIILLGVIAQAGFEVLAGNPSP
jgi:hypothetical protein